MANATPVIPNSTNTVSNSSALANTVTQYPSEWVYPNTGYGTYITGSQVRIYVGNLFVDEANSVQVMYYANSVPIYGYSSRQPDAFGHGRNIVQGQLRLNFVSEGYLYTVLNEYNTNTSTVSVNANVQNLANLANQQSTLNSGNTNSTTTTNQINQLGTQINAAASNLTPSQIDAVQALINTTTLTTPTNAINYKVPFNIRMNCISGGRTIQRTISDCLLVSNEQIIDQSGETIADSYGFIARRFT